MGLYLLHLHLHGLFRGQNLELGRDADTGGQSQYVLQLAQALGERPELDRLELITRCIEDPCLSADYSLRRETLSPKVSILRLPFGPSRYLSKEQLWPHLRQLVHQLVLHISLQQRRPHWIHAHYADAGWVGAQLQRRLGIPLIFTGHSLGREKQRRLLALGQLPEQLNRDYCIDRRIAAEEAALAAASLVITSSCQEAQGQYVQYKNFHPELPEVIPPGVDQDQFHPHGIAGEDVEISALLAPFLGDLGRPCLLALSRLDRRKNIPALVAAFGSSDLLRQHYNLVLVLGCRQDLRLLGQEQRQEWQLLLEAIDRHNLYGQVAYPKQHSRAQVPALLRWVARRRGLFVNPALTEPFGLTLLEAAACGLPVVATDDGGPVDILQRCGNGLLVNVALDGELRQGLERATAPGAPWDTWRAQGLAAVAEAYHWSAHARRYLRVTQALWGSARASSAHQHLYGGGGSIGAPARFRKIYAPGQGYAHAPLGPRLWLAK